MLTVRDVTLFMLVAGLASMQVSACSGEDERPPPASTQDPSDDVPLHRLPETTADFEERTCWTEVRGFAAQCGYVSVPEADGSDVMVRLGVMRVFSPAESPAPDPVVYLDGGPGGSTIQVLDEAFPAFAPLAKDRDVIFVDQRGTGVSEPNLDCTESGELDTAIPECFARLSEKSDLSTYNSAQNAKDFDLVRRALGYDEWNLLGISYGTRLGLTILRDRPEGVRAAILDAVVPLEVDLFAHVGQNGQSAFEEVFAACAADPVCAEKYPNPMAELRTVAAELDAEPLPFPEYELRGQDFVLVLFNLLYSPFALVYVPQIIHDAAAGDFSLFEDLAIAVSSSGFSFGMHLSVQCREELPFTSPEVVAAADAEVHPELLAGLTGSEYFDYCGGWPVPAAPAFENEPVSSSVPTLVMAGRFDPITPPEYSEMVFESLEVAQFFVVDNDSHGSSLGECGLSLVSAFLRSPSERVDPSCLSELPAPEFESRGVRKAARRVGGGLEMATEPPTAEDVAEAARDIRRRSLL